MEDLISKFNWRCSQGRIS